MRPVTKAKTMDSSRRWRSCFQSTSRRDKLCGPSLPMLRFPYVCYADILCVVLMCFRWVVRSQDDNKGVGELVRPLSRFEIARIVASARQRVPGRVTSPSEWLVLRKLQLQQVCVALSWKMGSIDAILFLLLAGKTESGYKGVPFAGCRYAYDADPARRSTLCASPTCSA